MGCLALLLLSSAWINLSRCTTVLSMGKGCEGRNRIRRIHLPRPFPPRSVLCHTLHLLKMQLTPSAENKYSHAAVWPLVAGYELTATNSQLPPMSTNVGGQPNSIVPGSRNYPVTAMVANLAKATPDKPALMRHDDVVTFFHEMGHVFHGLLSRVKFSRFHGTR